MVSLPKRIPNGFITKTYLVMYSLNGYILFSEKKFRKKFKLFSLNYFPQNKKGPICGHVTLIRCKTCNILGVLQRICVTCPQIGPFLF